MNKVDEVAKEVEAACCLGLEILWRKRVEEMMQSVYAAGAFGLVTVIVWHLVWNHPHAWVLQVTGMVMTILTMGILLAAAVHYRKGKEEHSAKLRRLRPMAREVGAAMAGVEI